MRNTYTIMGLFLIFSLLILCVLEFTLFTLFAQVLGGRAVLVEVLVTGCLGLVFARGKIPLLGLETLYEEGDLRFKKLENALVLSSGLLLMVPGLLTDVLGIILLSPEVRKVCAVTLVAQPSFRDVSSENTDHRFWDDVAGSFRHPRDVGNGPIIDGECHEVNSPKKTPKTSQGSGRGGRDTKKLPRRSDVSEPTDPPESYDMMV